MADLHKLTQASWLLLEATPLSLLVILVYLLEAASQASW